MPIHSRGMALLKDLHHVLGALGLGSDQDEFAFVMERRRFLNSLNFSWLIGIRTPSLARPFLTCSPAIWPQTETGIASATSLP